MLQAVLITLTSPMPLMMDTPQSTASRPPTENSTSPTLHLVQLAVPFPFSPHVTLHLQITRLETSTLIFLTSTDPSTSSSLSPLGSFVYAMPNVLSFHLSLSDLVSLC